MKDECFGIVPIFSTEADTLFLVNQHQAGHLAFPKGHANPGESPAETARREFQEETGISDFKMLDEPSFTEHYSFVKDGEPIEKTVTYFLGFINSREVVLQVEEIQNSAWVSFEEAVKLITFDANRLMFAEVKAYLDVESDCLIFEKTDINKLESRAIVLADRVSTALVNNEKIMVRL